jgi:hypothetical protein
MPGPLSDGTLGLLQPLTEMARTEVSAMKESAEQRAAFTTGAGSVSNIGGTPHRLRLQIGQKKDCRTVEGTFVLQRFYKSLASGRQAQQNYLPQVSQVWQVLQLLWQCPQQPLNTAIETTTATTQRILRILKPLRAM